MLVARGQKIPTGVDVVFIGLEPENIRRIQGGQPLYVRRDHPAMQGLEVEVVITTAEELAEQAEAKGAKVRDFEYDDTGG